MCFSYFVNSCDLIPALLHCLTGHNSLYTLHKRCLHKLYKYDSDVKSKSSDSIALYIATWTLESSSDFMSIDRLCPTISQQ